MNLPLPWSQPRLGQSSFWLDRQQDIVQFWKKIVKNHKKQKQKTTILKNKGFHLYPLRHVMLENVLQTFWSLSHLIFTKEPWGQCYNANLLNEDIDLLEELNKSCMLSQLENQYLFIRF